MHVYSIHTASDTCDASDTLMHQMCNKIEHQMQQREWKITAASRNKVVELRAMNSCVASFRQLRERVLCSASPPQDTPAALRSREYQHIFDSPMPNAVDKRPRSSPAFTPQLTRGQQLQRAAVSATPAVVSNKRKMPDNVIPSGNLFSKRARLSHDCENQPPSAHSYLPANAPSAVSKHLLCSSASTSARSGTTISCAPRQCYSSPRTNRSWTDAPTIWSTFSPARTYERPSLQGYVSAKSNR
jgi:hypothetical protein